MNTDFAFQIGVKRGEWMSSKNGRFLYAAQTHLSQDTEIRTALRASVLAHYVLSLARASDNSCELLDRVRVLGHGQKCVSRQRHTLLLHCGQGFSRCLAEDRRRMMSTTMTSE